MKKSSLTALSAVLVFGLASCGAQNPSAPGAAFPGVRTSTVAKDLPTPVSGKAEAKTVVKVFSDFQCPACQRFHEMIEPRLIKEYAETGKVLVEHRNYPLPQHQNADGDALAGYCAAAQGKYPEFAEGMFALEAAKANNDVSDAERAEVAKKAGVPDAAAFDACMKEGWYVGMVERDRKDGDRLGLDHTPSAYVGGKLMEFKSVDEFFTLLDAAVATAK